jgi:tRNA dimethylallyltransferase
MKRNVLLVITGPTAVGKTDFSISVAQALQTEIISADSRQIYKEMKIGTACPNSQQLSMAPHHFIGTQSIHQYYNASMYEMQVIDLLEKLFQKYNVVVLTGGSGLYIDAVCYGIDDLPTIDQKIRNQLLEQFKNQGIEPLREELLRIDPEYCQHADLSNPKRILKALEIYHMTQRPYSSFLTKARKTRNFEIYYIVLNIQRPQLHEHINLRVDAMMGNGLLEEAKELYPYKQLNALNTVGYKELFDYFDNKINLETAIELIKRNTRRYARRQLTWFKKYENALWIEPQQWDIFWNYLKNKEIK